MRKTIDLTGKFFFYLEVSRFTRSHNGQRMYECKCECGRVIEVVGGHLVSGNTKSCGCYKREYGLGRNREFYKRDVPYA